MIKKLPESVFFLNFTIDLAFKSNYSMDGLDSDKAVSRSHLDPNQIVSRCIGFCPIRASEKQNKNLTILFCVFGAE